MLVDEDAQRREQGLTPMLGTAIALHEWFIALSNAGFSEDQALRLICHAMTTNPGEPG